MKSLIDGARKAVEDTITSAKAYAETAAQSHAGKQTTQAISDAANMVNDIYKRHSTSNNMDGARKIAEDAVAVVGDYVGSAAQNPAGKQAAQALFDAANTVNGLYKQHSTSNSLDGARKAIGDAVASAETYAAYAAQTPEGKQAAQALFDAINTANTIYKLHPDACRVGAAAVGGAVLAPVLAPAVLGALGFGYDGVAAGSAAAGWQAGIGNVAAGSLFAGAQSVGAGGAIPAIGSIIGAGIVGGSTFAVLKATEERDGGGEEGGGITTLGSATAAGLAGGSPAAGLKATGKRDSGEVSGPNDDVALAKVESEL